MTDSTNSVYRPPDEIIQLKALVQDALDKKGVLSKLKAELRQGISSILLQTGSGGLDGSGDKQQNLKLAKLKSSREGKLILDMISEFFAIFDLKSTGAVFSAEAGLPDRFNPQLRPIIKQEINLPNFTTIDNGVGVVDEPLLFSLLRNYETIVKTQNAVIAQQQSLKANNARLSSSSSRKISESGSFNLLSVNQTGVSLSMNSLSAGHALSLRGIQSQSTGNVSPTAGSRNLQEALSSQQIIGSNSNLKQRRIVLDDSPQIEPNHPANIDLIPKRDPNMKNIHSNNSTNSPQINIIHDSSTELSKVSSTSLGDLSGKLQQMSVDNSKFVPVSNSPGSSPSKKSPISKEYQLDEFEDCSDGENSTTPVPQKKLDSSIDNSLSLSVDEVDIANIPHN